MANIGPLIHDNGAVRQLDARTVNALSHLRPGYGKAIENIKDILMALIPPNMN